MSPPAKRSSDRDQHERSPLGQATLAGLSACGAYYCHQLGAGGNDLASLGAIGLSCYAALSTGRWMKACQITSDRHRHARRLESFASGKGAARLGTPADAKEAGRLGGEGFHAGQIVGSRSSLILPWQYAIGVCGPPGVGKSNLLIGNLLQLGVGNTPGRVISFVANDGSLELFAVTAAAQLALGRKPVLIGPDAQRSIEQLGLTERSVGVPLEVGSCNPFSWIKPGPNVVEDCRAGSKIIHPGVPREKATGNQTHFDRRTQQILLGGELGQMATEGKVTLPGMRRRIVQSLDDYKEWLELMTESDFAGGMLRDVSQSVLALATQSPEEFSGGYSQAVDCLEPYAPGSRLAQAVEEGVDLEQLPTDPTAIFLAPGAANQHWTNMFFGNLFTVVQRGGGQGKVAAILEEAPSLGPIHGAVEAVAGLRKHKLVTLWLSQDAVSQYRTAYGADGARSLTSQFSTMISFAVRDHEHAKLVSERTGEETVPDGSMHVQYEQDGVASKTYTGNYVGKPVIRPSEVMTLPKNRSIVVSENHPTFVTEHTPYYQTSLRRRARRNPYYK